MAERLRLVMNLDLADLRGWLQFDEGHAHDSLLKLSAADIRFGESLPRIGFEKFELEAAARRGSEGYDVRVRRLAFTERGGFALSAPAEQQLVLGENGRIERVQLATGAFELAPALEFAQRANSDPDVARRPARLWVAIAPQARASLSLNKAE